MTKENSNDEVNLFDLYNLLKRYKHVLWGLPILGALSATVLVTFIITPTWEASAVLEIGKVGQATQATQATQALVEPITNMVTRMMLPSFSKGAINSGLFKTDEFKIAKAFYDTLKATQVKGAELVEIKLRGPSPEFAEKLIHGAIINLQKMHLEMMQVSIDKNKKQLQLLSDDIQKATSETDLLRKKLFTTHNWNAFDATLSATLLKDKSAELRDMIQRKLTLEEQLTPSRTYTTRVVDEVYISEGPVSPKKPMIIGLAILLGLFGAVVFMFVHNAVTKKTE